MTAAVLVACAPEHRPVVHDTTRVVTVTATRPAPTDTAPVDLGPLTRQDAPCPFIATPDAADREGNRIGRVVVLRQRGIAVGCEFYFDANWGYPRMTMRISSARYRTASAAYTAMVGTATRGAIGVHDLVPGVDAVLYQTRFYTPDGDRDWACTFAKGTAVVSVVTDQTNTSADARSVATAIAPHF